MEMFSGIKKFAAGGRGDKQDHHEEKDKEEQSLTTILPTHEDRASLLLLVVESLDAMRAQLTNAFEAGDVTEVDPTKLEISGQSENALSVSEEKAAEQPPEQSTEEAAAKDKAEDAAQKAEQQAQKRREQLTKALAKEEFVALKKASIAHFDQWRENVLERVGGVVNQKADDDDPDMKKAKKVEEHRRNDNDQQQKPMTTKTGTAAALQDDSGLVDLQKLYPPQPTPLRDLDDARRVLVLHSLLLLFLSLETYQAESRVLMLRLASALAVPPRVLAEDEGTVAKGLLEAAKHMSADEQKNDRADKNSTARKWKVGLGAAAGAVLIGVTGGLAAPLLAAGVGTVMGGLGLGATATAGYLGALAGSAPLVGVLFGAYGGKMTGEMIDEYAKQVEDFAFLPIHPPGKREKSETRHLRVAIGISGWLLLESEVVDPWKVILSNSTEAFALRFELEAMLKLGNALTGYVASYAWGWAKKEIISRTIFAALSSALTLPYGLAKASRVIDNPFSVAKSRSDKAGAVLADALINKVQGERPVTLIGYSMGSRVIYACLNELANRNAFGLVESVCLIGSPVPSDTVAWRRIRSVVPGRIINIYSTKDYLLGYLYRTSSLQYGVAGLQTVRDVEGVENVDVSDLVDGHTQYRFLIGSILQKVGIEGIDAEVVEQQMKSFRREEEKKKKDEEEKKQKGEEKSPEAEAEEMEREIERNAAKEKEITRKPVLPPRPSA
ncbi:kinase-like domain-containing protein [Apiospora arundinis]